MNLRTTLLLAALLVVGGAGFYLWTLRQPHQVQNESISVLENELTADKLTRIEISRGERHMLLERKPGQEWTLPGQWPVRKPEVEHLVEVLVTLRTRFIPYALGDPPDLKPYGLARDLNPLAVKVTAEAKEHTLTLADEPGKTNSFSRPTFLRVDENAEVLRLAPGLVAELSRPEEYYMQRRLLPAENIAKEGDTSEKVEHLAAREISFKGGPAEGYDLARTGSEWELRAPFRDRPDPDKLQKILTAAPDIWAERFVDKKDKKLDDFGLNSPEEKLTVALANGGRVTLLVGKQARVDMRKVMKPAPPFGPPRPPQMELVRDEYRYAKLGNNEQIFEIKADRLKDLAVSAAELRDARLARFRTEDVKRLEVKYHDKDITVAKEKDQWRLQKPKTFDAETSKVTELLDKLSGLEAKDADVIEKGDAKLYGLDKPAVVQVSVEEKKGKGDDKTTQKRDLKFLIGKHDKDKKKLYVQVAGWPRINAVDDGVEKLLDRPALAYRGRRVLDFSTFNLAKMEIHRGRETFTLEQVSNNWQLASPVQVKVDQSKADQLAGDLSRLEVSEFVATEAKTADMDKLYGLSTPDLSVKLTFTDAKKPAETLMVGKQRDGKQEYYARLGSDPAIFVVKKDTRDVLDKDSLAYRPLELWRIPEADIAELRVRKDDHEFSLKREGSSWKIGGPFTANAVADMVRPMTEAAAELRGERFVAHTSTNLGAYGLDKPYLRVAMVPATKNEKDDKKAARDKAKDTKTDMKERVLLVGKLAPAESKDGNDTKKDKDTKGRYARLGDSEAIFVLGEKTVAALDHRALDLLERNLLSVSLDTVKRVVRKGEGGSWTLQKEKEKWWLLDSPVTPFVADEEQAFGLIAGLANLRAKEFAAYGPKPDLAAFGLDTPVFTITLTVQPPAEKDKAAKPVIHMVALGKPVKDASGDRYARLDDGPGVAVLDAALVKELSQNYLDFVNHDLLKLNPDQVTDIKRQMNGEVLEIVKNDKTWRLLKPADTAADQQTLEDLLRYFNLRAKRIAAFPAKELTPFGLDPPAAVITIRSTGAKGKPSEHRVQIGKAAAEKGKPGSGERFARIDKSDVIVVLQENVSRKLLAGAIQFRNHDLAKLDSVSQLVLERGPRQAVFSKVDETWKMTGPVSADAEQGDLESFVKSLSNLRADELVTDRPADLRLYGLDRPQLQWRISAPGKEALTLQVGAQEKDKGEKARRYARLGNGTLVFLLSLELTAQALAEYRNRKVLSALDTAQVEKIRFGYESNAFELQKIDNKWQIEGKPGVKLKEEAVRDVLGALANLQVRRYVVDKGADLKLFGLQPPFLALEMQSASTKHSLHIGHVESESRRRYGIVPGMNSGAVFVLGEREIGQIARPLQAFIDQTGKSAK
jgi:hypothetical protein